MRLTWLVFLCALLAAVLAWDKEDYEIFDIVAELERGEGKGVTFYSFLNVSPSASTSEITKAYRSTMLANHPDKNPGNKAIAERHTRLTTIGSILRNKEARKRYDFWLKRGVPYWKGGAYLFARFRPGLFTAITFLALLTALLQATVQRMNATKDVKRIARVRNIALSSGKRRCRVPLRDDGDIFIDCVVDGEEVSILDRDGSTHLITEEDVQKPSLYSLWPVTLTLAIAAPIMRLCNTSGDALHVATEPVLGEEGDESDEIDEKGHQVHNDIPKPPQKPLKASEKLRNTRRRRANK